MTSSADVYGIIPKKGGGYVLAKTKFAEGVECVSTDTLVRMMKKDRTIHFVSFGFEEVDMMHEQFDEDGKLVGSIGRHLVPIAVFGSLRTGEHFRIKIETRSECFERVLCMDGISTMGQDGAKCWHTELEVVK